MHRPAKQLWRKRGEKEESEKVTEIVSWVKEGLRCTGRKKKYQGNQKQIESEKKEARENNGEKGKMVETDNE